MASSRASASVCAFRWMPTCDLRDPEALGGDAGRELARLAHDHVWPPFLDRRQHSRQRGARVEPDEQFADHVVRRPGASPRENTGAQAAARSGGSPTHEMLEARAPQERLGGRRPGDETSCPVRHAGLGERERGPDMPGAAGRGKRMCTFPVQTVARRGLFPSVHRCFRCWRRG